MIISVFVATSDTLLTADYGDYYSSKPINSPAQQ